MNKWRRKFDEMDIILSKYLKSDFSTKARDIMYKKMKWKSRKWLRFCVAYSTGILLDKMVKMNKYIRDLEQEVKKLEQ